MMDLKRFDPTWKASDIFKDYERLLELGDTLTNRRNLVRTMHDCLKVLLSELAKKPFNSLLGNLDVARRFNFLVPEMRELSPFQPFVAAVKHQRDRVDHSDEEAPAMDILQNWSTNFAEVLYAFKAYERRVSGESSASHLRKQLLSMEFELEVQQRDGLAAEIVSGLQEHGLTPDQIERGRSMFLESYGDAAEFSVDVVRAGDTHLIAFATIYVARLNARNAALIDDLIKSIAESLDDTPKKPAAGR